MYRRSSRLLALGFNREDPMSYKEVAVKVSRRRRTRGIQGSPQAPGTGATGPSGAPLPDSGHCSEEEETEVDGASSLAENQDHQDHQDHRTDGANDHPTGNSTGLYRPVFSLILLLIFGLDQIAIPSQWTAVNHSASEMENEHRTQMLQMKAETDDALRVLQRQHVQLEQQVVQVGRAGLLISEQLWARAADQGRTLDQMKADLDARIGGVTEEIQHSLDQWLTEKLRGGCGRRVADEMADFALESQGGRVLTHLCSPSYLPNTSTFWSSSSSFHPRSPSTVIQGQSDHHPGECWAFTGSTGHLVLSLSHRINISHVTLDHVAPHQTPTGRIPSAPKNILVYGMSGCEGDTQWSLLGDFVYDAEGGPSQTFALRARDLGVFQLVQLSVRTNWGHPDYTCLYRFRVHGNLPSQ